VLVAGEDDPHDTIRPRLDAHGADADRVHLLRAVTRIGRNGAPSEAAFTLADLAALDATLAQVADCALVVVDPIGSFMGSGVDAHRDNEVRGVLGPLAALAQRSDAAVLLVAHQRKGAASHADDLVLGSRAFTGIARSVLHLMIDPEDDQRRLLLPGKSNLSSPAAGLAFTIGGNPPRIDWDPDPVAMTADGVLAAQLNTDGGRTGRTERDDAAAWLRDYLADGPKLAREVLTESKAAGFSKRTIDRAKTVAGVRTRKEAFGGGWLWEFGTSAEERQPDAEDRHTPDGGNLGHEPDDSREILPKVATSGGLASLAESAGNLRAADVGDRPGVI
jgi:putative DNA primase/helicase